jgi:hypothetical protein
MTLPASRPIPTNLADGGDSYQLTNAYSTLNAIIERINATDMRVTFGFNGTNHIDAVTVTDATPTFSFSALGIGVSNTQNFRLDDVMLTYTPYVAPLVPAPAALPAGLAMLALAGIARRGR